MPRTLTLLAALCIPVLGYGQNSLSIDMPSSAKEGSLVVVSVKMKAGDDLRLMITQPFGVKTLKYRVFDEPRGLPSSLAKSDTLFLMPATPVSGLVFKVNFDDRTFDVTPFEIKLDGISTPPVIPDDPPIDPPTPPVVDFDAAFYEMILVEYKKISDPDKDKWARQMVAGFAYVVDYIEADAYQTFGAMMKDVQLGNLGKLGLVDSEPWPESSRKLWANYRLAVNRALTKGQQNGSLSEVEDYIPIWNAIIKALRESI